MNHSHNKKEQKKKNKQKARGSNCGTKKPQGLSGLTVILMKERKISELKARALAEEQLRKSASG